jgi:uncharacterized NAD(P)/FAD-binding protein YdhS
MDIHSQTLMEILQMIEAFKAQMHDTLHLSRWQDLADGLKDSFHSIQDSLDSMQRDISYGRHQG